MSCAKLDLLDHRWHDFVVHDFFCLHPEFLDANLSKAARLRCLPGLWFHKDMGGNPKIGVVHPKMDGENHGKPHVLMDDLGGKPTIFRKHPYLPKRVYFPSRIPQTSTVTKISQTDFRMFAFWCIMQAKVWGLAWASIELAWRSRMPYLKVQGLRLEKKMVEASWGYIHVAGKWVILPHCHMLWLLPFTSSMAMLGSTTNQPWEP